ncbi:DNA ligase D [Imbroritus primus]|uniref:DNA ligase D n=1 Tax=Imbroritus primus TaxID=3058603 RepID=A0ACD3SND8_9BURK|nr:DNA ligase D [Burkholderiaceae bacterium PBA]
MSAKDALQRYRARRDFHKTPEPAGRAARRAHADGCYVVQRHHASHLHYDFRLELDGVLKSWAVPKGPSLDPAVKRLAGQVEDHPLGYASFEGEIPAGQYGAGQVRIWDRGTWQPLDDAHAGLQRGRLRFRLLGGRLAGDWILVRTSGKDTQWLLRKTADAFALPGHDAEHAPAALAAPSRKRRRATAAPPATLAPQLATLVDAPPETPGWRYEIKYDGYRMLCRIHDGKAQLLSRNGLAWEHRTPALAALAEGLARALPAGGWLDGELVVFDAHGHSSFGALQAMLSAEGPADSDASRLHYVLFDIPWWDGRDLRSLPLSQRRAVLESLAPALPPHVQLSTELPGDGPTVWAAACALHLEGVIGKQQDAAYSGRRTTAWIKIKCRPRAEFVIGGWTEPKGQRIHLGALLLGVWARSSGKPATLRYVGRVGSGFSRAQLSALHQRLVRERRARSPFAPPPRLAGEQVHWTRPVLVAEVTYTGWTTDRLLRQAAFAGLRPDKAANEIEEEATMSASQLAQPAKRPRQSGRSSASSADTAAWHGVRITHAERVVFPDAGFTKGELARYYAGVAGWMLPWLHGRPLSLMRCPQGTQRTCFFQKHWALAQTLPEGLMRVDVPGEDAPYIAVQSEAGIVALVQHGVIELHQWGATLPRLDRPDQITFDLDPDPALSWRVIADAARLVRGTLEEFELQSFLRSTGGKGLHVVVPLRRGRSWEEVKTFARGLAQHLSGLMPERFTASMSKSRRHGRIFIDYLRNSAGNTAIVPYAVRARAGAPVAMPLAWDALDGKTDLRGAHFHIGNAMRHLEEHAALWDTFNAARTTLAVRHVRLMADA